MPYFNLIYTTFLISIYFFPYLSILYLWFFQYFL